jgi:integrase
MRSAPAAGQRDRLGDLLTGQLSTKWCSRRARSAVRAFGSSADRWRQPRQIVRRFTSLAGYRGLTRDACALDLCQFIAWCDGHHVPLLTARRADIACFARELDARATVARRLCTMAGFYRYAGQEGLLERSPAAHVRRPRLDSESHAVLAPIGRGRL